MKFDEQLAAYLYEFKTLKLEGIGTFNLNGNVSIPFQQDKEHQYSIDGLSFVYNPRSTTDEDVVMFLVKRLQKIEPLVRSDLEFYLANIKQFINLGKAYTIEGIGTLSKDNDGTYEFVAGTFLTPREESAAKRERGENNHNTKPGIEAGRAIVYTLLVLAGLAALGGIGWGISKFLSNRKLAQAESATQTALVDTSATVKNDSAIQIKPANTAADESAFLEAERRGDSVNYKMVFEVTPARNRAVVRTTQLNNYGNKSRFDSIVSNNTTFYRLYVPAKIRAVDTLKVKTTLSKHLGKKITIVKG